MKVVRIRRVLIVDTVTDMSNYPTDMSIANIRERETDRGKFDLLDQITEHELAVADLDDISITTQVTLEDV